MCAHAPMRLVASKWQANAARIEGLNNLILAACSRAPRISLPLLDARVAIRKEVGLGSREESNKRWSAVQAKAERIIEDA
eukprot:7181455-Pyramimonas_sp.AAC.1